MHCFKSKLPIGVPSDLPLPVFLVTALVFLLSGCVTVNWAPDYDPVMDETVSALQADTAAHFEKLGGNGSAKGYAANRAFYEQAIGRVEALHTRAEALEQELTNKYLAKQFEILRAQYVDLQSTHQKKNTLSADFLRNMKKAFDQNFRALLFHIRGLKIDDDSNSTS